jgi:Berberine and berberine like
MGVGASVGSGRVFQNFPDPELEDWADTYYGPNYQRLVRVKARYDPGGFFHFTSRCPFVDDCCLGTRSGLWPGWAW